MKQLFIVSAADVISGANLSTTALTAANAGKIGFYLLSDPETGIAKGTALTADFGLVVSKGTDAPYRFDEVNFKSLKVTKSEYQAGSTFKGTVTIPTPTAVGAEYVFTVVKKGCRFNERTNWSFSEVAKATTTADATRIAANIVKAVNGNSESLGVTATSTGAVITLTATAEGADYELKSSNCTVAITTIGKKATLDTAYVQNLASECAEGKGFEYTYQDGESIYPGYPESVPADKGFTMWTLQFAVPRVASKTRDEVVNQLVHIVMPETTKGTALDTLDTLLGLTPTNTGD